MSAERNNIECTAVFLDVRNFTDTLTKCSESQGFYDLIERVYHEGLSISSKLSFNGDCYINSTGDGFLCIFFNDYHYIKGFVFSLLIHLTLPKYFNNYFMLEKKVCDYWFGVGIESGIVKEVISEYTTKQIKTYIGEVINKAARLESLTKEHARAPIVFGPLLNEYLSKYITGISYSQLVEQAKDELDSKNAEQLHEQMASINSMLLSSYLFEHRIKGLKDNLPVFRVSPSLVDINKTHFWKLIEKLPIVIKNVIEEILRSNNYEWKL
ncbi:MAG TPA: adenylate/guanylate cyclase domain-containing protein [Spirochaetota bacterium]|nr:adenylate/guanylate cyclase domain-containing protein [Spirochaetota bacterium]HNT12991.1 adenylate/guanylate cyclase domain-containing protein [Spirochaetota bacterium]